MLPSEAITFKIDTLTSLGIALKLTFNELVVFHLKSLEAFTSEVFLAIAELADVAGAGIASFKQLVKVEKNVNAKAIFKIWFFICVYFFVLYFVKMFQGECQKHKYLIYNNLKNNAPKK
jgi:hypothetical protein